MNDKLKITEEELVDFLASCSIDNSHCENERKEEYEAAMPEARTLARRMMSAYSEDGLSPRQRAADALADQLAEAVLGAAGLKAPDYSIEHYFGETSIQSPASNAVWEKIVNLARKIKGGV